MAARAPSSGVWCAINVGKTSVGIEGTLGKRASGSNERRENTRRENTRRDQRNVGKTSVGIEPTSGKRAAGNECRDRCVPWVVSFSATIQMYTSPPHTHTGAGVFKKPTEQSDDAHTLMPLQYYYSRTVVIPLEASTLTIKF